MRNEVVKLIKQSKRNDNNKNIKLKIINMFIKKYRELQKTLFEKDDRVVYHKYYTYRHL